MTGDSKREVDLSRLEGDGSFKCPECGQTISPEDESDRYRIMGTKVVADKLKEIHLECGGCKTQIHLTGFEKRP